GQNPPSHALSTTAGNIGMNGSLTPHIGSKFSRTPTATTAATTATAYRLIGESVIRRRNSPRAVVTPKTPGAGVVKGSFSFTADALSSVSRSAKSNALFAGNR